MTTTPTAAIEALRSAVDALAGVELDALAPTDLLVFVQEVEVASRQVAAEQDRVTGRVERSEAFKVDGYLGARGFLRGACRLSSTEAGARLQVASVLERLPLVAKAYEAGEIPVAHVRRLGQLGRNRRVADEFDAADALFRDWAVEFGHAEFCMLVASWERLADQDGADRRDAQDVDRRRLSLTQDLDGGWTLVGRLDRVSGAVVAQVLEQFEVSELYADWDEAREAVGDSATVTDLPRTAPQRRADALVAMAGSAGADRPSPEPVVNIVIDEATFNAELARRVGAGDGPDPERVEDMLCATLTGAMVQPGDAVEAALAGFVRRVVVDSRGVVINLGRTRRLFSGSSRTAALIGGIVQHGGVSRCSGAGCDVGVRRRQIDHRRPWALGGRTDQDNADPRCPGHNRLKEHGYRTVRGPDGRWRHLRPDGTEITEPV